MVCLVLSVVSVIFAADAVSPVSCFVTLSSLVDGIAQILIFVRLPFASTVRTWQPLPQSKSLHSQTCYLLLLPQSWSLSGFGCSPASPSSQSQTISNPLDCISLTPSSSPSSQPPSAVPNASKFKHFRDRSGQKTPDSLSNNLPSSQAFSRPTTTEVSPFPGSVDQPALVFLQSCRLTRCG